MKLRLLRPRELARNIVEIARRRPAEAEEYLDAHQEQWEALAGVDPHDAADILEAIGDEAAAELLSELGLEDAADVLEEMRPGAAADVLEGLAPETAADVVEVMESDGAADVVAELEEEARRALFAELEEDVAREVLELLAYPPDSAGGLMTPDVAVLPVGLTVGEAIEALRRLHEQLAELSYVYITDYANTLVGVLSFRELVFARPGVGLDEVMVHDPIAVLAEADREEVAELIQRYNLFGLPVVDGEGTLLGMITVDDVIEAVQQEATEDMATMVGAGAEESVYTPVARSVRMRLPWISVNLATAFVAVGVISRFERTLDALPVLAAYMPVVASMGGNGGSQSLAVVIRALALGQFPEGRRAQVIRREMTLGLFNGAVIGIAAGMVAGLLAGGVRFGIVMAVAAWANMIAGGLAGAGIPLLMRRFGFDPALASHIFLTMITDTIGFGGFLLVAALLL